ncbi:MAG: hypothetical protein XD72_0003 [Methanothrix harundinacea]|uniref:Uncharacterized protein n=1 Tax=Methanothrix harundinacea TaxID=301375 RepID=A0A101IK54_9EURY|nr:MAG: hypothetical protein XD72_0003 [Methanothrix harundinacea]KUK96758.1 MAG: hypothetical protein XE07_0844 [Methanothrix harundinacea]
MALTEVNRENADLQASDSDGEFSKELIAEVLEAEKEGKTGLCKRFDSVDDLLASLDE